MTNTPRPHRHEGAVVIVTGSTRGIGAGIAKRFVDEGASVVISGRTVRHGEEVVDRINERGGDAIFVRTEMAEAADINELVRQTIDEYGRLDVLVNNAAIQTETSVTETTLDEWDRVLDVNFRAYWLCAKCSVPHMETGCIINISSNHAFVTMPAHFPYNSVKAGIDGMTRAMALDLGPDIRVNTINSGWIAVERTTAGMSEEDRADLESIHPLGRIGTPEDIAGVATFLASDDAAFMTGANLLVDGGRTAVMQDDTLPNYRR